METESKLTWASWIAALESGKYVQAQKYLHTTGGFCCLGVACDVAQVSWKKQLHAPVFEAYGEDAHLPMKINDVLGLASCERVRLMEMNDRKNKTFSEIAAYLRSIQGERV